MSPASGGQSGDPVSMFLPLVLIMVVFYFLILRPQKKRQKEREALLSKVEKGDKVVTSSGMHGTVAAVEEGTVLVQVADNVKIRFEKSAINSVVK